MSLEFEGDAVRRTAGSVTQRQEISGQQGHPGQHIERNGDPPGLLLLVEGDTPTHQQPGKAHQYYRPPHLGGTASGCFRSGLPEAVHPISQKPRSGIA